MEGSKGRLRGLRCLHLRVISSEAYAVDLPGSNLLPFSAFAREGPAAYCGWKDWGLRELPKTNNSI